MSLIDPEAAFFARVAESATLGGLLGEDTGGDADIRHGFPAELEDLADAFISYFRPSGSERPAIGEFLIQTDIWVPPHLGDLVKQVDDAMLALFNEVQWFHNGGRIWSVEAGAADYPAPPDRPMRRRRNYRLTVS